MGQSLSLNFVVLLTWQVVPIIGLIEIIPLEMQAMLRVRIFKAFTVN